MYAVLPIEVQKGKCDNDHKGRMCEWLNAILVAQPMRTKAYGIILSLQDTVIMRIVRTAGPGFAIQETASLPTADSKY